MLSCPSGQTCSEGKCVQCQSDETTCYAVSTGPSKFGISWCANFQRIQITAEGADMDARREKKKMEIQVRFALVVQCTCPTGSGLTWCEGLDECYNLQTDNYHCGACDNSVDCLGSANCVGGKCTCTSGETYCPETEDCENLQTDWSHCGTCTNDCIDEQICSAGHCIPASCPSDQPPCAGKCCPSGDVCSPISACIPAPNIPAPKPPAVNSCPSGQTCGTTCCSAGQMCSGGACVTPPAQNSGGTSGTSCPINNACGNICCGPGWDCGYGSMSDLSTGRRVDFDYCCQPGTYHATDLDSMTAICCPSSYRNCGGSCCNLDCVDDVCQPWPSYMHPG